MTRRAWISTAVGTVLGWLIVAALFLAGVALVVTLLRLLAYLLEVVATS